MSDAYLTLVHARKECRLCNGLTNPANCVGGFDDGDDIGPWSKWHGNLKAELMVVGQDWGDTNFYAKCHGIEDESNPTNRVLVELIQSIGLDMNDVFLTNAILCLKEGGLQAPVKQEWFSNCEGRFLKPTIEIVKPKILVTLGEPAYRSVERLFGLPSCRFRAAVDRPEPVKLSNGTMLFAMYHCGARILNTHRPIDEQEKDWLRVGRALRKPGT
jgi:uracil-DNA glycosylase family 4